MILFKNYLDKEFCKGIISYCEEQQQLKEAYVGTGENYKIDTEARRSKTYFIEPRRS